MHFAQISAGWLKFLGFDGSSIPEGAETEFNFTNFPESWGVFVLIAVALGLIFLTVRTYRRENPSCPMWAKHLISVFRILVFLVLLVIYLDPSISFTKSRSQRPVVTLVRDASDSMNIGDRYEDEEAAKAASSAMNKTATQIRSEKPTRAKLVNRVINADERAFLKAIEKKGRLRVLDFSDRVIQIDLAQGSGSSEGEDTKTEDETGLLDVPDLAPSGTGTDLSRAIQEGLSEKLTSAVIIFTDGQHNGANEMDRAAALAKKRGVPLYIVGVGDPTRPRNLSVQQVYADPQVWKSDPFELQAKLRTQGFGGEQVKVELIEVKMDEDGGDPQEVVLESVDLDIPEEEGDGQQRLVFTHIPEEPGMKNFTVRVLPGENESNLDDNQPAAPLRIKVLDDNARILLISGSANWEYRALTRLFMREKMLNISCWLQTLDKGREQQGNTPITELPSDKDALFEYDVVIMVDPDPAEFDAAWIDLLGEFVREHSGGLLFMAGPINTGKFIMGNSTGTIQDLLPVSLGDVAAMQADALGASYETQWPLGVVAANVDRPIMRFFPDASESLLQWKKMPGVFWSFPASKPKPASRVLIEHSNPNLSRDQVPRPLLVTGQSGSGRTTYVGFDGTWRWRVKGYDGEYFKRFWIQTTRYLVEGRALAGKRRGVIESDRFRYQVGDRIRLSAQLREANFDPYDKDEVKATLTIGAAEPTDLTFTKVDGQVGRYEASLPAAAPGNHNISITLSPDSTDPVTVDADFTVMLPIRETQESWLDKPGLMELAKSTGGQYFSIDQTAALAAAIPSRVRKYETQSEPMPMWDKTPILILLALLLTLEWAFRKKFKLL